MNHVYYTASVATAGYAIGPGTRSLLAFAGREAKDEPDDDVVFVPGRGGVGFRRVEVDTSASALFLDVAALHDADLVEFLPFANRFGMLEIGTERSPRAVAAWRDAARLIDMAWSIAQLLSQQDTDGLAQALRHALPGQLSPFSRHASGWHVWEPLVGKWAPPDGSVVIGPPAEGEQSPWRLLNSALDATADLRTVAEEAIYGLLNPRLSRSITTQIRANEKTGRRELQHTSRDLAGVLYFQVARAIAEGREFGSCSLCSKHFELVAKARGRREYCSTSCKLKAARARAKDDVAQQKSTDQPRKSKPKK